MNMRKDIILYIIFGLILLTISWIVGYNMGISKGRTDLKMDLYENLTMEKDTVTKIDTVFVDKPVPKYITQTKLHTDTIIEYHTATDTLFLPVQLPIIQKQYGNSNYSATISGVDINGYPKLDNIEIYQKENFITETKIITQKKKWNWGITGGVGMGYNPVTKKIEPQIGIVIGYGYSFGK